jgi:hypothetical protein
MTRNNLRTITVCTLIISLVCVLSMTAPGDGANTASAASLGWLKGRIIDRLTGAPLIATITVVGPISTAQETGSKGYYGMQLPYGRYSVTALKSGYASETRSVTVSGKWAVEYFALSSAPSEGTPPPPPPPPPPPTETNIPRPSTGRVQLISTKVGLDWPAVTPSNAAELARRYDILYGDIPASMISTLRAANPRIILLQYSLPGGEIRTSKYPDSYYVKDNASGRKVLNKDGYYLLNFAYASVRAARIDAATRSGVDGYWLDTAGPEWVNTAFFRWRDESGKLPQIGSLDGSWEPSMPESEKDKYTDGTWPAHMLEFIQELKAAQPGDLIIFNGFPSNASRNAIWRTLQGQYQGVAHGAASEFLFVTKEGPVAEDQWKWQVNRVQLFTAAGKYVHIFVAQLFNPGLRLFGFASYLLVADGKYVWLNAYSGHYDTELYAADYGMPLGGYEVITTPAGSIYKRQFERATVWVNPGNVTRSADGKTIGPKSAVIQTK